MFEETLVRIDVKIPAEIDRALAQLVEVSGVSKRSIIADALATHLVAMGVLDATVTDELVPSRTRGPGPAATRNRKEQQ